MKRLFLIGLMMCLSSTARAHGAGSHPPDPNLHVNPALEDCNVQFAPELTQDAFSRFAREFGSVSAFKMTSAPMTLGRHGFAVGLENISFTVDEHSNAWNDTFYHPDAYHELGSDKSFPKVRLGYGLNERLDLGAFYTENPNANYGWLGVEAKYGLRRQSETEPISLSLRGAYTKTFYVDDMNMNAFTFDVAAGRTFKSFLTPYLGVGTDLVLAHETSDVVSLKDENQFVPHALGGLEVRYWHAAVGAEVYVATLTSFQLHVTGVF